MLMVIFHDFDWNNIVDDPDLPFDDDDDNGDDDVCQVSYLMVEGGDQEWQELSDPYCGGLPTVLPHTVESYKTTYDPPTFPTDDIRQDLALRKDDLALNIEEGTWEGDWEGVWTTGEQEEGVPKGRLLVADPQDISETKTEVLFLVLSTLSHLLLLYLICLYNITFPLTLNYMLTVTFHSLGEDTSEKCQLGGHRQAAVISGGPGGDSQCLGFLMS